MLRKQENITEIFIKLLRIHNYLFNYIKIYNKINYLQLFISIKEILW
jgi:hypothetical protein